MVWLDGSDAGVFSPANINDGDHITQWEDKSPALYKVGTSGGGTLNPVYRTNVQNGKSALYFDGDNATLKINNFTSLNGLTSASFVWVGNVLSSSFVHQVFSTDNPVDNLLFQASSSLFKVGMAGGTAVGPYVVDTDYHIHSLLYDGTQPTNETKLVYRIDGNQQNLTFLTDVSGSFGTTTDKFYVGSDATLLPDLCGYIGEIVMYNKKLNSTEVEDLEYFLFMKWFGLVPTSTPTPTPTPTPTLTSG